VSVNIMLMCEQTFWRVNVKDNIQYSPLFPPPPRCVTDRAGVQPRLQSTPAYGDFGLQLCSHM